MIKFNIKHLSIFIIATVLLFSCETTDLEKIKALTNKEELPDVIIENLEAVYSLNGNTKVKLLTPKAYKYTSETKQYSLFPDGINLMFYDKNFNLHSSLTADYGIYYEKKKFAKAKGNVILTNVNGSVLKTEELLIDENEEKIYSVVPVNIKDKDGFEITGEGGFESNLDFTVYRFTDVSGVKIIKENESNNFFIDNNKK
ncbi:MAG: LPS export ABC transporter periplasmic protein LptC [Chlorobi bacterium]|nr:LPS export ABC transporter periplasmic protein LptC [Chlorobiota bacterium]